MDGKIHGEITKSVLSLLPDWQQKILGQEKDRLCSLYSNYPDIFAYPDPERNKEIDPAWQKYFPAGERLYLLLPKDIFSFEEVLNYTGFYFKKITGALKKGEYRDSAKYAGCLAHFIEDCGQPVHAFSYDLLLDLLPPPGKFQYVDMHAKTERDQIKPEDIRCPEHKVRLLGLDINQTLFHFWIRHLQLLKFSRSKLVPIIQAAYRGKKKEVQKLTIESYQKSIFLAADILHTLFTLAFDRITQKDKERLSFLDFTRITPEATSHFGVYRQNARIVLNANLNLPRPDGALAIKDEREKRQAVPLVLNFNGRTKIFRTGIGVLPWLGKSKIDYLLLPGGYKKFTAYCGLNAGIGQKGCVCFKIIGDGKVLFDSGIVTGKDTAGKIKVEVGKVRNLSLLVEEKQKKSSDFIYNHSVWAEPKLIKDD